MHAEPVIVEDAGLPYCIFRQKDSKNGYVFVFLFKSEVEKFVEKVGAGKEQHKMNKRTRQNDIHRSMLRVAPSTTKA